MDGYSPSPNPSFAESQTGSGSESHITDPHSLNVMPTLPNVLVLDNLPPDTSHTDLEKLIHSRLPSKDVSDNLRYHILDFQDTHASVELASSDSAHAVAESLDGESLSGCTISCSVLENPSLAVPASDPALSATPTPPPMGSMNPFFYMPPMYPVDYGYYGSQVPPNMPHGHGLFSRPPSTGQLPPGIPVQPHPGAPGLHRVPSVGSVSGMPNGPYGHPYGYYSGSDLPGMNMGYGHGQGMGPGSGYAPSYPSSRRSSTKSNSNFSRNRSSRNSSISLNRQNSSNSSFRRGSYPSRQSSMTSLPGRTNSVQSSEFGKDQDNGLSDFPVTESPVNEEVAEENEDEVDEEGMICVDDENGQRMRVNPRRLFVGNIPFNSTWPTLKNFLVNKAEELEPNNDIDILKVEIPMQQPREQSDTSTMGSYYYLATLSQQLQSGPGGSVPHAPPSHGTDNRGTTGQRGLSRGFAIVTTGNKQSSEKLIKHFNNMEFENRPMTVRFDRFPNFNNYVLQQLYPGHKGSYGGGKNKPGFLTNLAFERNSFQQKYYYGSTPQFQPMAPPFLGGQYYPPNRSYHRGGSRSGRGGATSDASINEKPEDDPKQALSVPESDLGSSSNSGSGHRSRKPAKMSMSDLGPPLQEIEQTITEAPQNQGDASKARELVDFVGDASEE
ncbi:hypothetical protein FT662_03291 [Candidozyma haemuli var. vulneris]|nr:hypothetical protein FT662_03291 [[Candida] haemuloni var. vulneris]